MKKVLSGGEVDDLFGSLLPNGHQTPTDPPESTPTVRAFSWSRCYSCRHPEPGLFTFHGADDWSPSIPITGPVRDLVTHCRKVTGRTTVLICGFCLSDPTAHLP